MHFTRILKTENETFLSFDPKDKSDCLFVARITSNRQVIITRRNESGILMSFSLPPSLVDLGENITYDREANQFFGPSHARDFILDQFKVKFNN